MSAFLSVNKCHETRSFSIVKFACSNFVAQFPYPPSYPLLTAWIFCFSHSYAPPTNAYMTPHKFTPWCFFSLRLRNTCTALQHDAACHLDPFDDFLFLFLQVSTGCYILRATGIDTLSYHLSLFYYFNQNHFLEALTYVKDKIVQKSAYYMDDRISH